MGIQTHKQILIGSMSKNSLCSSFFSVTEEDLGARSFSKKEQIKQFIKRKQMKPIAIAVVFPPMRIYHEAHYQ